MVYTRPRPKNYFVCAGTEARVKEIERERDRDRETLRLRESVKIYGKKLIYDSSENQIT